MVELAVVMMVLEVMTEDAAAVYLTTVVSVPVARLSGGTADGVTGGAIGVPITRGGASCAADVLKIDACVNWGGSDFNDGCVIRSSETVFSR